MQASMECELEHERDRRRDARTASVIAQRSSMAAEEPSDPRSAENPS
jgi:hypothetical protein